MIGHNYKGATENATNVKKLLVALLGSCALLSSCGCASGEFGTPFAYQNMDHIALGVTSQSDAVQLFGAPYGTANKSNTDGSFSILKYVYAFSKTGIPSASRVLLLEFKDRALNAYVRISTFEEDSTEFDFDAGGDIEAHRSTKADVLRHMGEPAGKAMCPSTLTEYEKICNPETEIWMWQYSAKHRGETVTSTLSVVFDADDIVSRVKASRE